MLEPIISVEHLSKKFRIGQMQSYYSLRDSLAGLFLSPKKRVKREMNDFWALKDINFNVFPGETVGIIGRNGAGKSTLLKVLSQINPPTKGKITMRGRVASLLEVGTGFHPELTGRENIYLNGAILGMSRLETKKKFDEIVAFAEVEEFIDTPVKRYSSGMYVRLAFAVAAHLEPDILIIDEVLAVGDAQFQKKCLGKMETVGKQGRTVLFVSHNMAAIRTLCRYGIYLKDGLATKKLPAEEAIAEYASDNQTVRSIQLPIVREDFTICDFKMRQNGLVVDDYDGNLPIDIDIKFTTNKNLKMFRIGFFLKTALGDVINRSLLADWNPDFENIAKGSFHLNGRIPAKYLVAGNYIIETHISRFGLQDYLIENETSHAFSVLSPSDYNAAHKEEGPVGTILIDPHWTLKND